MYNPEICKKFLTDKAAIIAIVADKNWKIVMANSYADHIFGKPLEGLNFKEFVIDFTEKFDYESLMEFPDKKHLLNVSTTNGLPQTFYFLFANDDTHNYAFGETNLFEVEELRNSFLNLNNDLNNLSRELQKKNSQLKKLNDQKNEFIGMAAHDLRNPIGVIMGYSEYILDQAEGRIPEQHIQFLKIILSSSEFMLKMLNDLLDISKIESGKLNLNKDILNPKELINRNINLNRVIAEKKGIKIRIDIFEDLPKIVADADKIEQVLNNLISNAIKFSNPESKIIIKAFQSNDVITVAVKDEGQGMPEEDINKLFTPFSQLSSKSTAGEKSTGLGLSITKKIITGHKGKIWVESKKGQGTTFYFSLPVN